jgi:hypothetical protein
MAPADPEGGETLRNSCRPTFTDRELVDHPASHPVRFTFKQHTNPTCTILQILIINTHVKPPALHKLEVVEIHT